MKRTLYVSLLVVVLSTMVITSCKKKEDENPALDSQAKQFNDDSQFYKGEIDQVDNDINNALSEIPTFGKGVNTLSSPLCGVTIDSSQIAQKILFFNFDGITPCFSPSRTRAGQVKVQLTSGTFWSDVNAVLTMTFTNFKVTRLYDNRSITFNGIKTLKNINGNDWIGFLLGNATLKYQERAFNIQVTYDNGAGAIWNSARMTQWSYNPTGPLSPKINFTVNGDTTLNGYADVDSWGVNRFAQIFTTYYTVPLVSNTYCGLWRPNAGQLTHHLSNSDYNLILGVDQNGNPTPYNCAYGFKISWTVNGNTYVSIISY
ncbi:MAG: hypothetical protein IPP71_05480 [Bacteroidetes bacterium]|nr:hypothetical protein [Bacteroidota bacterium]